MERKKNSAASNILGVITMIAYVVSAALMLYWPAQIGMLAATVVGGLAVFWLRRIFWQVPVRRSDVPLQVSTVLGIALYIGVSEGRLTMDYVTLSALLITPGAFVWISQILRRSRESRMSEQSDTPGYTFEFTISSLRAMMVLFIWSATITWVWTGVGTILMLLIPVIVLAFKIIFGIGISFRDVGLQVLTIAGFALDAGISRKALQVQDTGFYETAAVILVALPLAAWLVEFFSHFLEWWNDHRDIW
jgi:hypothetical protein